MAQVNAGRVRFVSRGEYNNSTQYYLFDLVDYNGSSYFAKANTTGNVPTNTTYWQLVAEKGNTGGDGPVGPTGNGIASIIKTASAGLIDTYTITFTDGTTTTFNVTNGQDGEVTQEYVDEENERLKSVFNVLPKVSDSGESVELENTGDTMLYKMDLKGNTSQEVVQGEVGLEEEDTSIYVDDVNEDKENYITLKGNTYQETTTGKNLFHIDDFNATNHGITLTIKDNTFTLNGTNDGTESVFYLSRTPITTGSSTSIKLFIEGGTATNTIASKLYSYVEWGNQVQSNITEDVINPMSANVTYNRYVLGIKGGTFNNYKFSPMIAENLTSTDTYEPYTNGASPNPDYPQEIEVVTGLNEVKVEGKNLLPTNQIRTDLDYLTVNSDGSFTINYPSGNNLMYVDLFTTDLSIPLGNYKMQVFVDGTFNGGNLLVINSNGNTISQRAVADGYVQTITNNDIAKIRFYLIQSGTNCTIRLELEEGTETPTSYVPYQSQTFNVNLGSIELCKIGTYQDRIYKSTIDNNWYVHKETGKTTFSGSENWDSYVNSTTNLLTFRLVLANIKSYKQRFILCNYYTNVVETDAYNGQIKNRYSNFYNLEVVDTSKTLATFKTWLSNNNVNMYYILATATDTQITDTTLISQLNALYNATIYSTTHINTETSNLLPYIDLKYNVVTASPSPDRASEVEVVKGNNTITISNEDGTKTQTFNLTLGTLELCKIGDYQDYIYYDKSADKWYKYKSVEKLVLDGTENYDMSSNGNVFYLNSAITNITSIENMKCNYYLYDAFSNLYNGNTDYGISFNTNINKIAIRDKDISSVNDFKTWLSNNNTIIYYPLATPTQTQITDQLLVSQLDELQKAMSYYDKTLITQTNASKPFILDVIAIRDLQDIFNIINQ